MCFFVCFTPETNVVNHKKRISNVPTPDLYRGKTETTWGFIIGPLSTYSLFRMWNKSLKYQGSSRSSDALSTDAGTEWSGWTLTHGHRVSPSSLH